MSRGNLGNPACEGKMLFIQVMGKDHPAGHEIAIVDADSGERLETFGEAETEVLPDPASVLHKWQWQEQQKVAAALWIETNQGGTIRLPLFDDLYCTERQPTLQHHVLQPVVPMAFWQSLVKANATHALPCRPGYLYLHYRGTLWREIEVQVSESGEWLFQDIDLAQHRHADGYVDDHREAVGQPLTELWLPARYQLDWLATVKVAFSDVQWSAARLNRLAAHPDERFQSVALQYAVQSSKSGRLLAPEHLGAQRERRAALETQLVHPPHWCEDLSGSATRSRYEHALNEQQRLDAGGDDALSGAWNEAHMDDSPLKWEAGLRADAAEAVCQAGRTAASPAQAQQSENTCIWQDLPEGQDILADARQREIPGLVIADPLFELRHALSQTQQAQTYLSLLIERCAARPHYRSALLVQKRIMPERIGGEDNPLHRFASLTALNYRGSDFHTHIATLARDIAHSLWGFHQERLAELLSRAAYQTVLADYFSLEGSDYISGFYLAQQCFTALSLDVSRADTLAADAVFSVGRHAHPGTAKAQRTLQALLEENSQEPLHAMCFPSQTDHPAHEPFTLPDESPNDGTGRFRAKALAEEGERSDVPDKDDLQTYEASLLAALARTSPQGELKRWADALATLLGRIAESGTQLLEQVADESERTALAARLYLPAFNASRAALPDLLGDLTFRSLNDVDLSQQVIIGVEDPVAGLHFGVNSAEKQYIAANGHRRFYGEVFRTSNNELLGGTNQRRLHSMGELGTAREVKFIVAPVGSDAAKVVRTGRQRIGAAERITAATRLPYIMVAVQAINLQQSFGAFNKNKGGKTGFTVVAALSDLGLAILNVSDYMAKRHQVPRPVVAISQFSQKIVIRNGQSNILTRLFPRLISANWLVTKFAGILVATSLTWEALTRLQEGDNDAAAAYGLAAAGATMLLLFSGPLGWVGLALLLGGGVAGIVLTDGPLEQWIKHGPFGEQRGTAPWLVNDPEEAYYRLQGILANIQVTMRLVGSAERDKLLDQLGHTHTSPRATHPMGQLWQELLQQNAREPRHTINAVIEVTSALPGMGRELEDVTVVRRLTGNTYTSPAGSEWRQTASQQVAPLLTRLGPQRISYYVNAPPDAPFRGFGKRTAYRWQAQVQLRDNQRFYPAPAPLTERTPEMIQAARQIEPASDDDWIKETLPNVH